jgi:hypothetical protein
MNQTRVSAKTLIRTVVGAVALSAAACASSPPPPPAQPAPAVASEAVPPSSAETSPPPADAEAQAQPECQSADDCKARGEPAAGFQWTCDAGRCMEQAAPEQAKAEDKPEPVQEAKDTKAKKKKGGKK